MSRRQRRRQRQARQQNSVDIILPAYGQPDFLKGCLESLVAFEAGAHYNIIIVDDVGPEDQDMTDVYSYATGLEAALIKHHKNKGFAAACNTGVRKGRAPLVLLLNTDTLITHDGWLKAMVDEFQADDVGVVGALLTFFPDRDDDPLRRPAGMTQHAGVAFDIMGRPYHIFWGWSPEHPKVAVRREMGCVTGACLMTRRKLWRRLGGLDTDYTKGNFEDVQFCVQSRMAGFKVIFTPEAHLHHFSGGSGNAMTADINSQIFNIKCGPYVAYDEWRFW